MMQYHTLIDALYAQRATQHGITFIEGQQEQNLSYAQLYDNALGLLHALQAFGLRRGDELIFFLRNNQKFIEAFWACLLGGIVPVPVAVGISDEHRAKLLRIFQRLEKPFIYTDHESSRLLLQYTEQHVGTVEHQRLAAHLLSIESMHTSIGHGQPVETRPDDVAFIQFSSGSTREPKGVVLTHKNLLATNLAMGRRLGYQSEDISLSWMPLTHDLGIIGFHLNMLVFGMRQNIMPTDLFSRRPLLWLQKTHEKRATVLSSPNFGYKHYLKLYQTRNDHSLDLSCVRTIINGAEPISVPLCRQFLQTLAPHGLADNVFAPGYGLAEAGLSVALWPPQQALGYICVDRHALQFGNRVRYLPCEHEQALQFALEGKVVDDCAMRIADDDGKDLGEDCIGEIQIKGKNVTSGYYHEPAANEKLFTADGWLRTGDLGLIHHGDLAVTGRLKDIIFLNGLNYYPHDLEAVILQYTDVELGKVAVAGARAGNDDHDDILAFVIHRGEIDTFVPVAKRIRAAINEQTGLELTHVIPVARIPKTTSGKVQRRLLIDAYLQGEYRENLVHLQTLLQDSAKPSSVATCNAYEKQLLDICQCVLPEKSLGIQDNLFEVGISSLQLAEIQDQIDMLYPGILDMTDLLDCSNLEALAARLRDKLSL